jgi:hypothetical protein
LKYRVVRISVLDMEPPGWPDFAIQTMRRISRLIWVEMVLSSSTDFFI